MLLNYQPIYYFIFHKITIYVLVIIWCKDLLGDGNNILTI